MQGLLLRGEKPLQALQQELLANGKGVHRELESEGINRHNSELTIRNSI